MRIKLSSTVALWLNRIIFLFVIAMAATLPWITEHFVGGGYLAARAAMALKCAYYACCPVVLLALWKLDALLRAILRGEVFTHENVSSIRIIRWCCLGVSLICLPAATRYLPLWLMVMIMGFLSLTITVLGNVMKAAVAIREENDLTV